MLASWFRSENEITIGRRRAKCRRRKGGEANEGLLISSKDSPCLCTVLCVFARQHAVCVRGALVIYELGQMPWKVRKGLWPAGVARAASSDKQRSSVRGTLVGRVARFRFKSKMRLRRASADCRQRTSIVVSRALGAKGLRHRASNVVFATMQRVPLRVSGHRTKAPDNADAMLYKEAQDKAR